MKHPPALLFGIEIENTTMDGTVDLIGDLVARGRAERRTHQIATVNVDFLANAVDDPSVAAILRGAEVCLADGMPIVWASARLGMPLAERVAGADLVPRLFDESQSTGWRIHVLGSSPCVAERARVLIDERYPTANVTIDPGPMIDATAETDPELLDLLEEIDADILCVALGNPKQERFIVRHHDRLRTPVMIGVGGSLDMMVGERKRAPGWVQRIGMEWVVRALQEPKRLGVRYARDIRDIGPWLVGQLRANRNRRSLPGCSIGDDGDGVVRVTLGAESTPSTEQWRDAVDRIAGGATLRIDPDGATAINDRAAARLVGLVTTARRSRGQVEWATDPDSIAPALRAIDLDPRSVGCDALWRPAHRA